MSASRMTRVASASRGPTITRAVVGVEPHDVKRFAEREAQAAPLADRIVDDALMPAEHPAVEMDDVAGPRRAGPQPVDDVAVAPLRHEADVLAVGLVGDRQAEFAGQRARLALVALAERKAQPRQLLRRGGVQKIALVALGIGGAIERAPSIRQRPARHVMSRRQRRGAEIPRGLAKGRGT